MVRRGQVVLETGAVALPLTIERLSETYDIAILRSSTPFEVTPLRFSETEPEIGSSIYVLGNPRGLERTISEGLVSGVRERGTTRFLQISAAISPGFSGGPVVNADVEVVGVTVGYLEGGQNLNFAVSAETVRRLLYEPETKVFLEHVGAIRTTLAEWPGDSLTQNVRRFRLRSALELAAREASTASEFLQLAVLADSAYEFDLLEAYAQAGARIDPTAVDSARTLIIDSWRFTLLFDGEADGPTLRRMLVITDTQIAHRPRDARAHQFRSKLLARLDRGMEAITAARRAVAVSSRSDPHRQSIWVTFHDAAAEHGHSRLDDSVFRAMVQEGAASGWTWLDHARHLEEREEYLEAAAAYRQATQLITIPWPRGSCDLGRTLWQAEREDDALAAFRSCLDDYALAARVDTSYVAYAHRAISTILNNRNVFGQALVHARQSLAVDKDGSLAAYEMSRAYEGLQQYTEAASAAEEAIRLSDGRFGAMHFQAGSAYFELRDWSRCARAFEKAAELRQTDTASPYNAALCLAQQGFRRDAGRMMEMVLERDPNHRDRAEIRRMISEWRR